MHNARNQSGSCRSYHSPARQHQADETRRRILDTAARMLPDRGYAKMTIASLAREAGVSAPTVYAVFRSKRGILAGLLDRSLITPFFCEMCERARVTMDPVEKMGVLAKITRFVYENELPCFEFLRGAGVVDPELWSLVREREQERRVYQEPVIAQMHEAGYLRPELTLERALDTMWGLTCRPLFGMLVIDRQWDGNAYESWLHDMLLRTLLPLPATPPLSTSADSL